MSTSKIEPRHRREHDRGKTSRGMSKEVSPDSKCPICLDVFNNMSYLDLCLHKFCFCCIQEWSKNKAECPLCKQPFNSIYHSIKSDQDFKKYDLRPTDNGSFGCFGGARFRYRTTLSGVRRQAERTSRPPVFDMYENIEDPYREQRDRYFRRMMVRLAAMRRSANEGRVVRSVREQEIIQFRQELYRRGARVCSVRDSGRSRDTTAEFYTRNPACLHRLVPWLKRELLVLYGAQGSLVNIVQHIIMSCITRYNMEDGAIREEIRPFLQARTEHFLHEFISFAKSPFNMEAYDQHAIYDYPAPLPNEDSSSNSSVIAISEDEPMSVELDAQGDSLSSSALSQSAWDDETPGPSYSTTTEQSRVQLPSGPDSDSSVEEETREHKASVRQRSPNQVDRFQCKVKMIESFSSDDDDCVIIGFVKPTGERTPELVKLSSDSEQSACEETARPPHIRFTGLSPSPPALESKDLYAAEPSEWKEMEHNQIRSKERCSPSTFMRHESRSKSESKKRYHGRRCSVERSRERHRSRSRERRKKRRSRSADHRRSARSVVFSPSSVSIPPKGGRHSRSSSKDRTHSKWIMKDKRSDVHFSPSSKHRQSHNYQWQSCSSYSHERDDSWVHYTERRSHSREPHHKDRRRSRSRSYSNSSSPSSRRSHRHDKPGGKRKYKTRHLEEPAKNTPATSQLEPDSSTSYTKSKKTSKEKHKKSAYRSRSLSVEIICDGSPYKKHHKKKKKHKKKSKAQR